MVISIIKPLYKMYSSIGSIYLSPLLKHEWKHGLYNSINENVITYEFVFRQLVDYSPDSILDVGTGNTALPHLMANCGYNVTAIDKIDGYWSVFNNRHFYVIKDDITDTKLKTKYDFISCLGVIQCIPDHNRAVKNLFSLLKPGGVLVLAFPYNEHRYIKNVYKLPGAGYECYNMSCQVISRNEIDQWLSDNNGEIIAQEYYQTFSGEYYTFGTRTYPFKKVTNKDRHHLTCLLIKKRAAP